MMASDGARATPGAAATPGVEIVRVQAVPRSGSTADR